MVKVLKPFFDHPTRRHVRPGDDVDPTPGRHEELAANGLVEPPAEGVKAAAPVANKMAAAPENKAVIAPPAPSQVSENLPELPALPVRRGPGRPPKAR